MNTVNRMNVSATDAPDWLSIVIAIGWVVIRSAEPNEPSEQNLPNPTNLTNLPNRF
jgi:hypothetical protein